MAVVMRVGYFCTAGYTETGGIKALLEKIRSDVEWIRCFPAVEKPGPKFKREFAEPRREDMGVTGETLVARMRYRLTKFYRGEACEFDLVLLIDDADCRFKDGKVTVDAWTAQRQDEVREDTGKPDLGFVALFASPEVEAWLLADWDQGFGAAYPAEIAEPLLAHLEAHLLGARPWLALEDYGGKQKGGSCEHKLSEDVQRALLKVAEAAPEGTIDLERCGYSKKLDGPPMLRRVQPDVIATICGRYFKCAYEQLLAARTPAPSTPATAARAAPKGGKRHPTR